MINLRDKLLINSSYEALVMWRELWDYRNRKSTTKQNPIHVTKQLRAAVSKALSITVQQIT